jgi:hypothetical protein
MYSEDVAKKTKRKTKGKNNYGMLMEGDVE